MFTVVINDHVIKVQTNTVFTAVETVWYDGEVVSRHSSLAGSHHDFVVQENGESVQYDIEIGLHISVSAFVKVIIKRGGSLVFSLE